MSEKESEQKTNGKVHYAPNHEIKSIRLSNLSPKDVTCHGYSIEFGFDLSTLVDQVIISQSEYERLKQIEFDYNKLIHSLQ